MSASDVRDDGEPGRLAEEVRAAAPAGRSGALVDIDGPGGSGKSTLAAVLAAEIADDRAPALTLQARIDRAARRPAVASSIWTACCARSSRPRRPAERSDTSGTTGPGTSLRSGFRCRPA